MNPSEPKIQLIFMAFLLLPMACKRNGQVNSISVDPVRSGSSLDNTDTKFYDGGASLSADGTTVVFVSGRDSVFAKTVVKKAYKASWPKNAPPGPLVRVTATDPAKGLGNETAAAVSPDGKWVVLQVVKAGQTDLYLQDSAGQKDAVRLTNDLAAESSFSFSPDSQLLSWLKSDEAAGTDEAVACTIGGGTAAEVTPHVTLSGPSDTVAQVFWVPAASGYVLGYATVNPEVSLDGASYKLNRFATLTAATAAGAAAWIGNIPAKISVMPSGSTNRVLIARSGLSSDGPQDQSLNANQNGDGTVLQPTPQVPVTSEPAMVSPTSGSDIVRYGTKPGYDVAAAVVSEDGTAFMLNRFYYRCYNDTVDSFGAVFAIGSVNNQGDPALFSPRLTATEQTARVGYVDAFDYAGGGPCARRRNDKSFSRSDDKMIEMTASVQSTAANYRLAYATTFSPFFDGQCNFKSGDLEVWLVDSTGDKKSFYPLSSNQQPLVDEDRGRDYGCLWPLGNF